LGSGSCNFFVAIEAEPILAGAADFACVFAATILLAAFAVGCLLDCSLRETGVTAVFGDFLSTLELLATFDATDFGALAPFDFDGFGVAVFFDSTTEDLFFVALGFAEVDLAAFVALLRGFAAATVAFLLGFAVGNFDAACELADFLRAVGKVKLLAVWRRRQPQADGKSRSLVTLSMLAHVKISRVSWKTWIGQG
jgi:hypothetical protein